MTIISHRHKFIFVRPRKVAGTSIQIALTRWLGEDDVAGYHRSTLTFDRRTDDDDFGVALVRVTDGSGARYSGHDLPEAIRKKVGEDVWDEYFKFTVVRNPWDLVVSLLYSKFGPIYWRDVWMRRWPINFVHNLPRAIRLHTLRREFVRGRWKESVEAILREGWFDGIGQIPQFYFSRGEAYADYVVRFENLHQDFHELCRRLGLPPHGLPRSNTKPRPKQTDYRYYYTNFSKEYVADICRPMTDAFGYRFGDSPERLQADGP